MPGGSVAYVPGAVSGIESEAVIDGTSLSRRHFTGQVAFSFTYPGTRRSQGAEIRELAGCAGLRALDWPAIILRQRMG